jgi:undecaprenyl-diphosphatase
MILDILILNFVQSSCHNSFTDFLFPLVTALGNGGAVWIVAGVCLATSKKYHRCGIMLLVSLGVTFLLINLVLQPLVARPRPFQQFPGHILLIAAPHSYSFPSGHAGSSFSSAMVLVHTNRRVGIPGFALAALIAFSRVFLFVHYPSDVLAGACIGVLCALLVIKLSKFRGKYFIIKII